MYSYRNGRLNILKANSPSRNTYFKFCIGSCFRGRGKRARESIDYAIFDASDKASEAKFEAGLRELAARKEKAEADRYRTIPSAYVSQF